jgi:hypothetical protein
MFKLILFGALWLMAIAIITGAAFLYFNDGQHLEHEETMYEKKNG